MQAGQPKFSPPQNGNPPNILAESIELMRKPLLQMQPELLADRTGAGYSSENGGQFEFLLWQEPVILSVKDLIARNLKGKETHTGNQALIIHYFTTADGSAPVGEFLSYADLPGGRIYAAAFQGYAGDKLSKYFAEDLERLKKACLAAGGEPVEGSDASFEFQALPRVRIRINYWLGDEEFPSNARLCFDPTACHYLPIDVNAILGSMLVGRIIKAAGN